MTSYNFSCPRRKFVTGLASTTALGLLSANRWIGNASAATQHLSGQNELRGSRFELDIGYSPVNFTGKTKQATTINNTLPAPVLRWKEGEKISLNVRNNLAVDSSIHWHGIILPANMDGVPHLSFPGIKPGDTYKYKFYANQSGTYWYHSHSGFQEQTGMYGAIIIDPKEPYPYSFDKEYVVMLSDWSDESPEDIYANLKRMPHMYNTNERTIGDWQREIQERGYKAARANRVMWNQMRMSDSDISDVTGSTYTFLMNGKTPADGWVGEFKKGEKILLRVINGSAMTLFDVRVPGLKMTVVAADGQYVQPVTVDEFRIGVAETYDVLVEPSSEQAYTLFCQAIDRSGYARGTLTPNPEWVAKVPEMDESPLLSHSDMGMSHGTSTSSQNTCTAEHASMGHCEMEQSIVNRFTPEHATMGHSQKDEQPAKNSCTAEHAALGHCEMPKQVQSFATGKAGFGSARAVSYDQVKMGPQIDMLAEAAQYRMDDPGVGLRNNGRRVLTYADLFNLNKTPDPREPGREIELHLTGNMARYMWSMDGIRFDEADPIKMKFGERLRITLVNDTMMNHPVHLHGVWSDLETGDADYIPRKHTVIAQPGAKISYLVTADAKGRWAYHCHLLYHMPGMARVVEIA